ncbi:hypothetical protein [Candidatus Palauibacter sp.]|uniref:hypothetical protein n=1 Tax=Candidatus Palauibacter sp. TaxID=3101350 RepID=UPI003AF23D6D
MNAYRNLMRIFTILLFGLLAGCASNNPPVTTPLPSGAPLLLELTEGDNVNVDVSYLFSDPDGDSLTYRATMTDPEVAEVFVFGSELSVSALAAGSATVAITASDPDDLTSTVGMSIQVQRAVTVEVELCQIDRSYSAVSGRPTGSLACNLRVAYRETIENNPTVQTVTRVTDYTADQGQIGGAVVSSDDQIYYWHLEDKTAGQANLWKTPVSGGGRTSVTSGRSLDIDPSVAQRSPYMVFASNRNGRPSSLWLVDQAAGVGLTMATQSLDADYQPSQSPDGAWVAFERWLPNVDRPQIWKLDLTTRFETQLREGLRPRVSADGSQILYNRQNPDTGRFEIWRMNADGGDETVLSSGADHDEIQPSWSPDGNSIVFASNEGRDDMGQPNYDIWALSINEGTRTQLTTNGSYDDEPVWHPDGRIFFRSNRGGVWNLWYLVAENLINRAPELVGRIPAEELNEGQTVQIAISRYFYDPERGSLAYTATSSDATVVTTFVSGGMLTIEGTGAGTETVTAVATDPNGLTASQDIGITVTPAMRGPELVGAIPADFELLSEGDTVTIDVSPYFRDPEGGALAYAARISDTAVASVSVSGSVITIAALEMGSATITITTSNSDGLTAMQTIRVTVQSADRATAQGGSHRAPLHGQRSHGDDQSIPVHVKVWVEP